MSIGNDRIVILLRKLLPVLTLLMLAAFLTCRGMAQSSNAHLSGIVTDTTGASIQGATVVATDTGTGVPYQSKTNDAGVYVFNEIQPGLYQLTVSKPGFGTFSRDNIVFHVGDSLSQNVSLKAGSVAQTVTVSSAVALLSSDTASISVVLDNKMITELPQLNRDVLDLTATVPSVQGAGPLSDNIPALGNSAYAIANSGNSYSLSGGQVNGTNITVDGNPMQDSEWNASNRSIPPPDSIGEFRVETGALTADTGRYSGGIISVQTKSEPMRIMAVRSNTFAIRI